MDQFELSQRIRNAQPGTEIHLPPGRIEGAFVVPRAVTLIGAGRDETIIDGGGRGAVLAIDAANGETRLEGLTITGGRSRGGGGLSLDNGARVYVRDCRLTGNSAAAGRGGGANVDRGELHLEACELLDNHATEGGAVFIGGNAKGSLRDCFVAQNSAERGGGLAFSGGAQVRIEQTRLEENQAARKGHHLYTWGTSASRPRIVLAHVVFGDVSADGARIVNASDFKAEYELEHTAWPEDSEPASTARPRRRKFTLH